MRDRPATCTRTTELTIRLQSLQPRRRWKPRRTRTGARGRTALRCTRFRCCRSRRSRHSRRGHTACHCIGVSRRTALRCRRFRCCRIRRSRRSRPGHTVCHCTGVSRRIRGHCRRSHTRIDRNYRRSRPSHIAACRRRACSLRPDRVWALRMRQKRRPAGKRERPVSPGPPEAVPPK